jgi:hypothetical protein
VRSPTPIKRTGLPTTALTESVAPPRASPSILLIMTPVSSSRSWNAFATVTASCPVVASTTSSTSWGLQRGVHPLQLVHQRLVDLQASRGVHNQHIVAVRAGV